MPRTQKIKEKVCKHLNEYAISNPRYRPFVRYFQATYYY